MTVTDPGTGLLHSNRRVETGSTRAYRITPLELTSGEVKLSVLGACSVACQAGTSPPVEENISPSPSAHSGVSESTSLPPTPGGSVVVPREEVMVTVPTFASGVLVPASVSHWL